MSYRNDHDAALARVDALEHEVARLASENAELRGQRDAARPVPAEKRTVVPAPAPAPPARDIGEIVGVAVFAIVFSGILPAMCITADHETAPAPAAETETDPYPMSELEACLETAPPAPPFQLWDHISYVDVDALQRAELPCRDSLPRLIDSATPTREEREILTAVQRAEQRLDGIVEAVRLERDQMAGEVPHNTVRIAVVDDFMGALRERNDALARWNYVHLRRH